MLNKLCVPQGVFSNFNLNQNVLCVASSHHWLLLRNWMHIPTIKPFIRVAILFFTLFITIFWPGLRLSISFMVSSISFFFWRFVQSVGRGCFCIWWHRCWLFRRQRCHIRGRKSFLSGCHDITLINSLSFHFSIRHASGMVNPTAIGSHFGSRST